MTQLHVARFKQVEELPEYLLCCDVQRKSLTKNSGTLLLVDVHDTVAFPAVCVFCSAKIGRLSGVKVVRNDSNPTVVDCYLTINTIDISEGIYEGGPLNVESTISCG